MSEPLHRIRSFVAWVPRGYTGTGVGAGEAPEPRPVPRTASLSTRFTLREPGKPVSHDGAVTTFVLGDHSEAKDATEGCLGRAVRIHWNEGAGQLVLHTSIVALPPVFVYRGPRATALTSDPHLLVGLPGVDLELHPAAVMELGHFGHPVGHRTLFRNLELVQAGSRVVLSRDSRVDVRRAWTMPERTPLSWPQFLEAQISVFSREMARLDLNNAFLSLTAGLDTRTVFAALAAEHRLVPCVTMTGPRRSLDARIAARLSHAYGMSHIPVVFDDRFRAGLPGYLESASRLSGGQASLAQAPEVFLYEQVGGFTARLSGNLGNQVGRGGTEGVSLRRANLSILGLGIREHAPPSGHWLLSQIDGDERSRLEFILHNEIPFTLIGNFTVGNHYAAQQSPYASRALIESMALRPVTASAAAPASKWAMRLRDVRHRFLGEPETRSFQRAFVRRTGGYAARCPVNWGWRPSGGMSVSGAAYGAATLAGMWARAKGLDAGFWRKLVEPTGLASLHDFRDARVWLHEDLRSFTLDLCGSRIVRQADIFDEPVLQRTLNEYFRGRHEHFETVLLALDLALAHRTFCA